MLLLRDSHILFYILCNVSNIHVSNCVLHITKMLLLVAANFRSVGVKLIVIFTGHFIWQLDKIGDNLYLWQRPRRWQNNVICRNDWCLDRQCRTWRSPEVTRWFKYDRDWFVCKQAALRSSCATLREWSHNLHPPSCSG